MRITEVQILRAGKPTYWYAGLKGSIFTVYDNRRDYILKEDYDRGYHAAWRHIDKDECREAVNSPSIENKEEIGDG